MSRTCDKCNGSGKGEKRQSTGCNGLGYRIHVGGANTGGTSSGCVQWIVILLWTSGVLYLGYLFLRWIGA